VGESLYCTTTCASVPQTSSNDLHLHCRHSHCQSSAQTSLGPLRQLIISPFSRSTHALLFTQALTPCTLRWSASSRPLSCHSQVRTQIHCGEHCERFILFLLSRRPAPNQALVGGGAQPRWALRRVCPNKRAHIITHHHCMCQTINYFARSHEIYVVCIVPASSTSFRIITWL